MERALTPFVPLQQLVRCLSRRQERRHDEVGQEDRTTVAKDATAAAAAAATNVSMELDVLDCSICSEPVSPPVFQCSVGHLVCSSCHGKRKKCHHCSGKSIVYERSYAKEKVLGSIQVPCSNAEYGCAVKISCPEISCGFTGSTGMLLAHLTTEHRWPSAKFSYGRSFSVDVPPVQEAAAHVVVVLSGEDDDGRLFLLDVAPAAPVGCVVAVFCVRPREDETKFLCEVSLTYSETENNSSHIQSSEFLVPSTTLADGIPRDCSRAPCGFLCPDYVWKGRQNLCHYEQSQCVTNPMRAHCNREANSVAHELARVAYHDKLACNWVDEPPSFILGNLMNDVTIMPD